jgi:hypothetical protein
LINRIPGRLEIANRQADESDTVIHGRMYSPESRGRSAQHWTMHFLLATLRFPSPAKCPPAHTAEWRAFTCPDPDGAASVDESSGLICQ